MLLVVVVVLLVLVLVVWRHSPADRGGGVPPSLRVVALGVHAGDAPRQPPRHPPRSVLGVGVHGAIGGGEHGAAVRWRVSAGAIDVQRRAAAIHVVIHVVIIAGRPGGGGHPPGPGHPPLGPHRRGRGVVEAGGVVVRRVGGSPHAPSRVEGIVGPEGRPSVPPRGDPPRGVPPWGGCGGNREVRGGEEGRRVGRESREGGKVGSDGCRRRRRRRGGGGRGARQGIGLAEQLVDHSSGGFEAGRRLLGSRVVLARHKRRLALTAQMRAGGEGRGRERERGVRMRVRGQRVRAVGRPLPVGTPPL